jgi:hypothetical protein
MAAGASSPAAGEITSTLGAVEATEEGLVVEYRQTTKRAMMMRFFIRHLRA